MVRPRCRSLALVLSAARLSESNVTRGSGPPGEYECADENRLGPPSVLFDGWDVPADDEGGTSSESDGEGEEVGEGPSSGPVVAVSDGSDLFDDARKSRTFNEFWSSLRCDDVFATERPIPTREVFSAAIALYNSIQDETELRIENKDAGGIFVELEVRQAGSKGRGIFALEGINKGARWRSSYDYTAVFYQPKKYRSFLLGFERGTACDVMQWAYAEWVRLAVLNVSIVSTLHRYLT